MKILHTSDWHLGQSFFGYDRCSEGADMMRQLAVIVADERPDALVVAGDVFHNAMPSNEASRTYVAGVLALHESRPSMPIVIIAGNHDSAARLAAYGELWRLAGVTIAASRREAMVPVPAGGGMIVPIAYQHPGALPEVATAAIAAARRAASACAPVVAVAHQGIVGADYTGHYRQPFLADSLSLAEAGLDGADYVALGHIHRPQPVAGTGNRARYCGSPLPVHFDEAGHYTHSVDIVEIAEAGAAPVIHTVPISPAVPLLTVPDVPVTLDEALIALEALPADAPCYVRLNVAVKGQWLPGDAKERAIEVAARVTDDNGVVVKRFCEFAITRDEATRADASAVTADVEELSRMEPLEAAERYLRHKGMEPLSDDERGIFEAIQNTAIN